MRIALAVVGSRDFDDYDFMKETLDKYKNLQFIISGGARGADKLAERYAKERGIMINVIVADWSKGKMAGLNRNVKIVEMADRVAAFWDGQSKGTEHTINIAKEQGKKVDIYKYNG